MKNTLVAPQSPALDAVTRTYSLSELLKSILLHFFCRIEIKAVIFRICNLFRIAIVMVCADFAA